MDVSDKKLKFLLIGSILVVLTLVLYWQVRENDFVNYDDPYYIVDNPTLRKGFDAEGIACTFTFCATKKEAPLWHPLTWLSLMMDYKLYGLNPAGYHLTNLFLHIADTLLLFLVLNRMTRAPWRSAFVAALFAVHPLHVESVAWATERKDVLSTFFGLLTVGVYLYDVEQPSLWKKILALLFFSLGLMTKSMLVTLPFVLLLLDYWPLRRSSVTEPVPVTQQTSQNPRPRKTGKKTAAQRSDRPVVKSAGNDLSAVTPGIGRLLWEKVPFLVLSLLAGIMTIYFHHKTGGIDTAIPLLQRLGNAALSYTSYLWKMFWPAKLAVFYPYHDPLPAGWVAASVFLLLLITAGVLYLRNRKPYLLTGWFWYLGTLVPVIGIVQAGEQAMADRYTYIPLIGLFIMIAWGAYDLSQKLPQHKVVLSLAAVTVLAAFTAVSWKQIGYWKNSMILFEHAIAVTKNNHLAHHQVGVLLADQGRITEALPHFLEAIRVKPDYARARVGLGNAWVRQGRLDEAESQFREAMRIQPAFLESYLGMGTLMQARGKTEEGIAFLRKALEIDPAYPKTYFLLGEFLFAQGKTNDAMVFYKRAIELNPQYADAAYNDLGIALRSQGKIPEAMAKYREAIRINPRNISAYMNLGNILVSQGRIDEGVHQFQAILQIDPGNINALNRLGSALLIQGKTAEAISCFRRVLNINPQEPTALQALHYIESNLKRRINR
jgi:tetratricopeptide (TPR) repeat protein